ncbi:MarR family transcriptional regulator [Leptospira sp. 201903070]|uniref:MarR family transcriptional regulator n=1 Tax=Leptospira ainlahdjerensis TaxID=2810033 RepID=A0ABS2UGH2_9LEPT|nr:MarR family transcriptional regulator [Leptospira ainlahdjerensis]MBM9579471.1 MarR family transcriptional regulator [Leptospira ainlahdjerensis]
MVLVKDAYGFLIVRSNRLFRLHFQRFCQKHEIDISQEQWFLLNKIAHSEGLTQGDLTDDLFGDKPNISRMVEKMEQKGWIRRVNDSSDHRILRLHLTKKGNLTHEKMTKIVGEERTKIYAGLSSKDFKEFERILGILETNLLANL